MSEILPPPLYMLNNTRFCSGKRAGHTAWFKVGICAIALCFVMPVQELRAQPSPPAQQSKITEGEAVQPKKQAAEEQRPDADTERPATAIGVTSDGAQDKSAAELDEEPNVEAAVTTQDGAEQQAHQPDSTVEPTADTPSEVITTKEPAASEPEPNKLNVAIWSGAYGAAQKEVVINRFKAKRDIDVDVTVRTNGAPIDLGEGKPGVSLDAGEFSAVEIEAGCSAGQLVKIATGEHAHAVTGSDGARADFLPGSLKPCGIGTFAWSHVIAINRKAFKKQKPQRLVDLFDAKRFPGKRALIKDPRFLLETALMADGVLPGEVYGLLATTGGQDRAFARLDQIKKQIIWVDSSKAAIKALGSGDAAIAQTFSGRAFFSVARGLPLDIIWDGQIYSMTYWAIPTKSTRQDLALEFLRFATEPQQMAAIAQRFPYGPTRTSALALTKRHMTAGLDLGAFLPTAPENLTTALEHSETWWRDNRDNVEMRFMAWLSGVEAPKVDEAQKATPAKAE